MADPKPKPLDWREIDGTALRLKLEDGSILWARLTVTDASKTTGEDGKPKYGFEFRVVWHVVTDDGAAGQGQIEIKN